MRTCAWPTHAPRRAHVRALFVVCVLHAIAGYWLWQYAPTLEEAKRTIATIVTVSLRTPDMAAPETTLTSPKPLPKPARAQVAQVAPTNLVSAAPASTETPITPIVPIVEAQTTTSANANATQSAAPPASLPGLQRASREIQPPQFDADYLNNPAPSYPSLSRRAGEQGRVILRVHVDIAGNADAVEIKDSCGFPRLDQAAMEAVRKWKFLAAKQGDDAIAAWVLVPITFSLRG